MSAAVMHVGLTVTDLARSRRFYEGAFGFRYDRELALPATAIDALLALDPPSDIHAVYLRLGAVTLELMAFDPPAKACAAGRAFNQTGLAHLSLAVGDRAAALARVGELGGTVLTQAGRAAVVRDPDGALIELVDRAVHEEVERGRAERER
jgi:catechol 2,3-dioxygenase-like lactoylglutathione lyase family enzyme